METKRTMTHASLFSGIGGAELAASWMGWTNLFHCELNPFCRKVLEYWLPNSTSYEDITTTDFTPWRGRIDILTGGFPCQPFSLAGNRKGAEDDRYLWPHMLRAIREVQPAWVVGENVAGLLTMVQPGQAVDVASQTALFGEDNDPVTRLRQTYTLEAICQDLENAGYSVQPFLVPACAVGAPHRRDRLWIVAGLAPHADHDRQRERTDEQEPLTERHGTPNHGQGGNDGHPSCPAGDLPADRWRDFPTQSPVCGRHDGLSALLDGISFPRWREESLKAYGNAMCPQVAYEIFRAIEAANAEFEI